MKYTYLFLNLITILGPVIMSFEKKIRFFRYWKPAFTALTFSGLFFLSWDYLFTYKRIWSFNPDYLTGFYLGVLPIEEILFFITVPFACLFIYEVVRFYYPAPGWNPQALIIGIIWGSFLIGIALMNIPKLYTSVKLLLTGGFLLYMSLMIKPVYMAQFWILYLIHLIPFALINGVLTSLPVVRYDDYYNLGIRLGTIPIEDTQYSLLLLLMTVAVFEHYKQKHGL
ncbi:MAG: lycopene cyclase domain-containing protein [Bacteroidetes bacterium]|nr:lycopene cyclase domain-containing protein [Bacteroidota bacterium]